MPRSVDLGKCGFIIEPRYWFWGWSDSPRVVARASTARALVRAKRLLPKGWNFKIWDCTRPRKVQLRMIASFRKRLRAMQPKLHGAEFEKLVFTFASRPKLVVTRPDHHRTGGAVDLTLVDASGRELWFGTDHDDLTPRAALDFHETHPPKTALDREAAKNRRLLKRVMTKAGFEPYAPEWWHWGYPR